MQDSFLINYAAIMAIKPPRTASDDLLDSIETMLGYHTISCPDPLTGVTDRREIPRVSMVSQLNSDNSFSALLPLYGLLWATAE